MNSRNILFNFKMKRVAADSIRRSAKSSTIIKRQYDDNTCPDCQIRLVRLGNCFSCPLCGYGGCA